MIITYDKNGAGYGIHVTATINSQTLTPEEAITLFNLVDSAEFFSLPPEILGIYPILEWVYTVTIEFAGKQHTVKTETGHIPPSLQKLCDWLDKKAH